MRMIKGVAESKLALTRKVRSDEYTVSPHMAESLKTLFGTEKPQDAVAVIIDEVRKKGDDALREYSLKISGVALDKIEITKDEIDAAFKRTDPKILKALEMAADRIKFFHEKQIQAYLEGLKRMAPGTVYRVLARVGMYVPGGTASYPSSVLMTAIPAKAAGVGEVIICTPPGKNGRVPDMTLAAASIAGVNRVFAVGGAQAIAAMAYGTESVPVVDKICGPGNIFVMLAKKQVYGSVDIDGLQGPSEILVIADKDANPAWCAADILAQAEHDSMAQTVLVTTSEGLALKVKQEIDIRSKALSRQAIIEESLSSYGLFCIVAKLSEAVELANLYAPEHLVIFTKDSEKIVSRINNAGCIFVGAHPTVVMGDYVAGPSHALPTGGTARFASPLNTTDFIRLMNVVKVDDKMMSELGQTAAIIAAAEELTAHAQAVRPAKEPGK